MSLKTRACRTSKLVQFALAWRFPGFQTKLFVELKLNFELAFASKQDHCWRGQRISIKIIIIYLFCAVKSVAKKFTTNTYF